MTTQPPQHDDFGPMQAIPHIPYATPAPRTGVQVWASVVLLSGGLGLVWLGGCFLIGVLFVVLHRSAVARPAPGMEAWLLMMVLYVLAFACFCGALWLIVLGVRGLVAIWRR
jgi:hypothetical protein